MRMRLATLAAILVTGVTMTHAQEDAFLGKWNLTGQAPNTNRVYWLEVKQGGGKLSAMFLNRGGSPVPAENIKLERGQLMFTLPPRAGQPTPEIQLKAAGKGISGTLKSGDGVVKMAGVRPPDWGAYDANAKHTFGKAVELFNGKSLEAWGVQHKEKPMGWRIEAGVMTNERRGNNLVSLQKFQDFRIQAEYKLEPGSNSGIYLRGRYELQVLDDAGKEPESHGHMAIYGRKAPDVNASKPPAEWQSMEAILVGNRVTVFLNGKKVQDNAVIDGLTGGALDANELEPGPVMIQGDHEKIWFRKVTVFPILDARKKSS